MRISVVVLLGAMFGCAKDGPCASQSGKYLLKWVQRSGNCGSLPEQIVTIAPAGKGDGTGSNACSGGHTRSSDQCTWDMNVQCGIAGGQTTLKGTVNWDEDGKIGTGILEATVTDPYCRSTYDVTYTKL